MKEAPTSSWFWLDRSGGNFPISMVRVQFVVRICLRQYSSIESDWLNFPCWIVLSNRWLPVATLVAVFQALDWYDLSVYGQLTWICCRTNFGSSLNRLLHNIRSASNTVKYTTTGSSEQSYITVICVLQNLVGPRKEVAQFIHLTDDEFHWGTHVGTRIPACCHQYFDWFWTSFDERWPVT